MRYVLSIGVIACGGMAVAGDLPGTMNFDNQTTGRISQTSNEDSGDNVKEVTHGDIDNDGDLDVVIGAAGGVFGNRRNKLYRNDGGAFLEISPQMGGTVIPGFATLDLTRHTFIMDFDLDGWNDILVANDELGGGGPYKLYMNNGSGTQFTDEGASRGLTFEAACGAEAEDWDQDGDIDIYSGNYPGPSQDRLYQNDGSGGFSIITATHVPVDSDYTIDVNSADLNGDGKLDLLVSNENDPYFAYYNDALGAANNGVGDFLYPNSTDNMGTSGDGAMEAADFNNDGMMDFYWTNKVGSVGDRILRNTGNDTFGRANFTEVMPPPYGTTADGHKISVADLNADGRVDAVVGTGGRPGIFRNTSVNGVISFVDWTPGDAFPSGSTFRASHAGLFDTNGDGDIDIFVGAHTNDHLFENVASNEVDEDDGSTLPAIFNSDPVAVLGHGDGVGNSDTYAINGIGSNSLISAVLNGPDDYRLELLSSGGAVLMTSDRGADGIEEALQYASNAGNYQLRVTFLSGGTGSVDGDADGDGDVDTDDLLVVLGGWGGKGAGDVNNDGVVNTDDLLMVLANWGEVATPSDYVLEVLSRTRN